MGTKSSALRGENLLEVFCTAKRVYSPPLSCTLRMSEAVNLNHLNEMLRVCKDD